MTVIKTVEEILADYIPAEDRTTKALILTAAGHYVSMKLARVEDSARILNGISTVIQQALPCKPEERLEAQQHFLTALSFEAYEPEVLCLSSQTWVTRLLQRLRGLTSPSYRQRLRQQRARLSSRLAQLSD